MDLIQATARPGPELEIDGGLSICFPERRDSGLAAFREFLRLGMALSISEEPLR
jgi:hypothetical protein